MRKITKFSPSPKMNGKQEIKEMGKNLVSAVQSIKIIRTEQWIVSEDD